MSPESARNPLGFSGAGLIGVRPHIIAKGSTWVRNGMSRRFWLTLHVPADQQPGQYSGELRLRGNRIAPASIPVRVKVHPFSLPEADMALGMYGMDLTAPYGAGYPELESVLAAQKKALLEAARAHGFTAYYVSSGVSGADVSEATRLVAQARGAGFPFITLRLNGDAQAANDSDDQIRSAYGTVVRRCREAGLPDPVWSFGDEPPETVAPDIIRMHTRIRDVAGARSTIAFSVHGENTLKLLDVTSVCDLNVVTVEHIKRAIAAGNEVYLNNQGTSRWAYGLYMWKAHQAGVSAHRQFVYIGTHADPYFPLDSFEADGGVIFPNRSGDLRPTAGLERIREGIDDYRYVLALTRAAARAGTSGAAARTLLEQVLGSISFKNTASDRDPQLSDSQLDDFRARMAQELTRLAGPSASTGAKTAAGDSPMRRQ